MKYANLKELALNWNAKFLTIPYHNDEDYRLAALIINKWHEDNMTKTDMTEKLIFDCINDGLTVDKGLIKSIHYMLFKDVDPCFSGDFRKHSVKLSNGYIPPDGIFINELMDSLLADTSLSFIEFYKVFQCIHPFHDGNGRVGGILLVYLSSICSGKTSFTIPLQ